MAILLPRHWWLHASVTVPRPGRAKRKAVVPSHPDCVCCWVCWSAAAALGITSACAEQEAWDQVFEIARAWEAADPLLTAKAHRHPHHFLFALLKPEQMDGLPLRNRLQEEIQCARNVGGKHFWNTKGEGATVGGGEPLDHEEALTPMREEKVGTKEGWVGRVSHFSSFEKVLAKPIWSPWTKVALWRESHNGQKRPGCSIAAMVSHWLAAAQGRGGLGGTLWWVQRRSSVSFVLYRILWQEI